MKNLRERFEEGLLKIYFSLQIVINAFYRKCLKTSFCWQYTFIIIFFI